jgi:DNA-binding FadR family transcriptional regulator
MNDIPEARAPIPATAARSRAEGLAEALDRRMLDEGLPAGGFLGTIEDLRRETGLARPTVSEAVRLLRDRGVLEIRPGRGGGLFVTDRGPVVRLRHTLLSVREEPTTVADSIELRDHLELLVDLGAARCRSDADIGDLRSRLEGLRSAGDWDAFLHANWALHERIAAICPNAMARAVYVGTLGVLSSSSGRLAPQPAGPRDSDAYLAYREERYDVHVELVEAIASGRRTRVRAAVARHRSTSSDALVRPTEEPPS